MREYLKIYKKSDKVIEFITEAIKKWKVDSPALKLMHQYKDSRTTLEKAKKK